MLNLSKVLQKGSQGEEVELLQEILKVDQTGTFNDNLDLVVRTFQSKSNLIADGIVGSKTWNALLKTINLRDLTRIKSASLVPEKMMTGTSSQVTSWNTYGGTLTAVSQILGIEPACALAILLVESGGKGFGPSGMPLIRFENHIFWKVWGSKNSAKFNECYKFGENGKNWEGHYFRESSAGQWFKMHVDTTASTQALEWEALNMSCKLAGSSGYLCASFGLGQILGSNSTQCGYSNVELFVKEMFDVKLQLLAMFEFIKRNDVTLNALRTKDFVTFASVYNGPGQPTVYGQKIKERYEQAKTIGL